MKHFIAKVLRELHYFRF